MIDKIDSMIKQEFERLGLNIVESEGLADLVITRVRHERMRRILIATGSGLLVAGVLGLVIFLGANSQSQISEVTGTSLTFSQPANANGSFALPQVGYVDIDGSQPNKSVVSYLFDLQQGWILQEITDSPNPSMGSVGLIQIYRVVEGQDDQLVQQYEMSSRTQMNQFEVPTTGQYRMDLKFTDKTFKGRVRVAIVRSK